VAPATSTRVTAACGVSNSSLPAPRPLNSASSSARLLPIGPLSLVNCCHTSSKICLRGARAARVTSPTRPCWSARPRRQGRWSARSRARAASFGAALSRGNLARHRPSCAYAHCHPAALQNGSVLPAVPGKEPTHRRRRVAHTVSLQAASCPGASAATHCLIDLRWACEPCACLDLRPITTGLNVSMVNPSSLSPSTSGLAPLLRRPPRLRRPVAQAGVQAALLLPSPQGTHWAAL